MDLPFTEAIWAMQCQVLAASSEQLSEAKQEIQLMTQLSHPNVLPLLAHSVTTARSGEGTLAHVVYMLFPLYQVAGATVCAATSFHQFDRAEFWS